MISFSKWVENLFEKESIENLYKGELFFDEYL